MKLGYVIYYVESVENTVDFYEKAVNAGATEVKAPTEKPWGQTLSYVRDLNGFLVEICSPIG